MDRSKTKQRKMKTAVVLGLIVLAIAIAGLAIAGLSQAGFSRAGRSDSAPATAIGQAIRRIGPHRASVVDYARLNARAMLLMQQPDMVGLAIGTIEDGEVRFVKAYGETLANSGNLVTPDTVFRWASLSKSVASALVVGLANDGKLSLDAPLSTMGTTLTLPGGARNVTVADLLSHRVGLQRNAWDERLEAGEDPRLLRAALGTLPALCPPARCYAYQNIAYDAATEIVERLTGTDYARAARARLFAPLGMAHATIGRAGLEGSASWARPHHRGRIPVTVGDAYYRIPAAGGVNTSIRDLLRWMDAQIGNMPGVLSPATLATMHRSRVSTPPHGRRGPMDRALTDAAYGLGWRTYSYAGHALVGHRGSVDGYGSLILFDPASRSGIVMMWNSNYSRAASLQLEFFDMLYGRPPTDWLALTEPPVTAPEVAGAVIAAPR